MSQQEMGYSEIEHEKPGFSYGAYEGGARQYGEKLSVPLVRHSLTPGMRLALAIVSLAMFLVLTFGLVGIAIAANVPAWAVAPILFIIILFTIAATTINVVFNRHV